MTANAARLFIGGITYEDLFSKYGPIKNISLKSTYGFVEFEDARDAKDALEVDGQKLDGRRIAVELSRGAREGGGRDRDRYDDRDRDRGADDRGRDRGGRDSDRDRDGDRDRDRGRDRYDDRDRGRDRRDSRGGGGGRYSPPRNTDYRVIVENLPSGCSWQDLKDHFRAVGDVCFSDVRRDRNGREMGVIEYKYHEDMRKAVRELDRSRMRGVTIDVFSDYRGKSHSRSRSPSPRGGGGGEKKAGSRSLSRSRSPRSKSPVRDGGGAREERKDSRGRSPSPEPRARSRSASPKRDGSKSRSRSRSRS